MILPLVSFKTIILCLKSIPELWDTYWDAAVQRVNYTGNYLYGNDSNSNDDFECPVPFVATDRYSVFFEGCNLNCEYSNLLWAQPLNQQIRVNLCKYIFVGLSLIFFLLTGINQIWDANESNLYFCERPLIAQCIFFIIFGFANLMIQFLIIPMIGADNVLCQNELNGRRGVSFGNPEAEWASCSILGIHFYFCLNIANLYVAAFTFSLWKQFYAPLSQSLWSSNNCSKNSCLFKLFEMCGNETTNNNNSGKRASHRNTHTMKRVTSVDSPSATSTKNMFNTTDNHNHNTNKCNCNFDIYFYINCINESFCICIKSNTLKYHIILWLIALILTISMTEQNMISAFHPMGICYGGNDDNQLTFWYSLFPLLIGTIFLILFVPSAFYLLCKTKNTVASESAKYNLQHLGCRLTFYFFGTLLSMICITLMAAYIDSLFPKLHREATERVECMLFGGSYNDCLTGYYIPEYTFYFCYISLFLAGLSSFVLSMHARQIKRWINCCPCIKWLIKYIANIKCCCCCCKNGVLMKIIDGKSIRDSKMIMPSSPSSKAIELEINTSSASDVTGSP